MYEETTKATVVANTTTNTAPQAFINAQDGSQLGFFSMSNHINPNQFQRLLVALNDSDKQIKLVITEGKNKNGKAFGVVRNPAKVVLGILSGYSATTLLAIGTGTALFTDATPVDDITDIINF
jgi:hypothetical protein